MKNYEMLATKIMINALEGVKAQIRKAYDKGYKDGKADTPFTDTEEAEKAVYKTVENMPPITPQQKYGKWILADEQNKEDVENDNYRFICSECQCSDIHAKGAIVPYCWKCGAKMQESEEIGEIHCNHTETEIAKSFIEDVEAVKELLPKAGK